MPCCFSTPGQLTDQQGYRGSRLLRHLGLILSAIIGFIALLLALQPDRVQASIDNAKTDIKTPYTLTLISTGKGTITTQAMQDLYVAGDVVTLTANADDGWVFVGWSGDLASADNPITLSMDSNKVVTATFAVGGYRLTINIVGNGAVQHHPDKALYFYGDQVILTPIPGSAAIFSGWSGDLTGVASPAILTLEGSRTVTATFANREYTLTVDHSGHGLVKREPDKATYAPGEQVNLTALPEPGWRFVGWSNSLGFANPLLITLDDSRTVTAIFVQENYTLTALLAAHGSVEMAPKQAAYHYGDIVTLTAIPDAGYKFVRWHLQTVAAATATDLDDNPLTITVTGNLTYKPEFAVATSSTQAVYLPIILMSTIQ